MSTVILCCDYGELVSFSLLRFPRDTFPYILASSIIFHAILWLSGRIWVQARRPTAFDQTSMQLISYGYVVERWSSGKSPCISGGVRHQLKPRSRELYLFRIMEKTNSSKRAQPTSTSPQHVRLWSHGLLSVLDRWTSPVVKTCISERSSGIPISWLYTDISTFVCSIHACRSKAVTKKELDASPLKMLIDRYYGLKYGYQIFGTQSGFGFKLADDKRRKKIELKYGID